MAENNEEAKPRRKKKKGHGEHGHHGGAWKVAFADFMTAMMALFLVLWLVSQADMKLKEQIANYFRSPGVYDTMNGGILSQAQKVSKEPTALTSKDDEQALFSVAQMLEKKFESKPEFSKFKDRIKIEVTDEGLKIQLIDKAERVSFPSGSAELSEEARRILEEIAEGLCSLPNMINIGGHTDGHVFASADANYTNWELSTDRANAARRVLESICVKPEQIRRVIGYADTEPLVPDDRYAPANRRISITVLRLAMAEASDDGGTPRPLKEKTAPKKDGDGDAEKKSAAPSPSPTAAPDKPTDKDKEKPADQTGTAEELLNRKKLVENGKVFVGETDKVPNKPTVKE